jgi:magnesium transporter
MTFRKRLPPVGARVGTLAIPEDAPPPRIHVFDYGPHACHESDIEDPEDLRAFIESDHQTWVDIQGFGDAAKLLRIGELFGLHPLTLEDATNVPQRAKSEIFEKYQLIIGRAPQQSEAGRIETPQVCMIVGPNFLLTFQDRYFGFFDPVRERLRQGEGRPIRSLGPGYLAYALLDTLIDHYFPMVEELATQLEELEEDENQGSGTPTLSRLHQIRRKLVVIRRVGWPQREALRGLARDDSPFVGEEVQRYLRNTEEHAVQIMEAVDSCRETTQGLVDIYMSNLSQRTNDVMKVLTLMASIFIPLTFIAGIYGMNFENMPELQQRYGYPFALFTMVAVAIGMLAYFRRKGWLGSDDDDG